VNRVSVAVLSIQVSVRCSSVASSIKLINSVVPLRYEQAIQVGVSCMPSLIEKINLFFFLHS
jgi:hypothetical protein